MTNELTAFIFVDALHVDLVMLVSHLILHQKTQNTVGQMLTLVIVSTMMMHLPFIIIIDSMSAMLFPFKQSALQILQKMLLFFQIKATSIVLRISLCTLLVPFFL
ncbi:unnamed protein product [Amoebophrya sp. A120]|nr:unnamed protein product [Amoebophrya sp. A120]|eukprot:GSA120T00009471001.1